MTEKTETCCGPECCADEGADRGATAATDAESVEESDMESPMSFIAKVTPNRLAVPAASEAGGSPMILAHDDPFLDDTVLRFCVRIYFCFVYVISPNLC